MVEESVPISFVKSRSDTSNALHKLRQLSFIFTIFSFGNEKVIVWDFTINPKNSMSCTGFNTHFFRFVTKPRCFNRKITEFLAINTSLILFPKINKLSR